jgi:hypothetical protein
MEIEIKETTIHQTELAVDSTGLVVLPTNWADSENQPHYSSTSLSFYKYAKSNAPIEFLSEPDALIEQRSGDWFAPTLLITQALIAEHPLIVNIISGLFTNYLSDFFKGQVKPKANVDFVIETKSGKKSKYVRLTARGTTEQLDVIMQRVKEIANGE